MNKIRSSLFKCIRTIGKVFYKRKVWLVSDRSVFAGDNGEAFFRFLKEKKVDAVFAIKKKSKDYKRLSNIGEIVEYESLKYRFLLCLCECHCSSQPIHMENHTEAPQIFLQHGVAETNISKIINPNAHDNFFVITSANREKESFLEPSYRINESHVWLTGLPRFDYLKNNNKNLIAIVFTWRENLLSLQEDEIRRSQYFRTITRILEDEGLNEFLKSQGHEICIMLHPEMRFLKKYISETGRCRIYDKSFNELYAEARAVITDYSSSVYDFLYLDKPVIYYQFDNGNYYNNPFTSKGYFDYEKDGFGPVTKNYDIFVSTLKKMVLNGCVMDEFYKKRFQKFIEYRDNNNCDRVYQKILEIINK